MLSCCSTIINLYWFHIVTFLTFCVGGAAHDLKYNGTHAYQRRSDLRICFFRFTPSDILGGKYVLQLSCHFWSNQLKLLNPKICFRLTTSIGLSMNFTIHKSVSWFKPKILCSFLFYLFVEEITEISRPHMQPAKIPQKNWQFIGPRYSRS